MSKQKLTPEQVSKIFQLDFQRRSYKLLSVEYSGHNGEETMVRVTDRTFIQAIRDLMQTLGLASTFDENSPMLVMTCTNVAYAEEYVYGLKVYLKEGNLYKTVKIKFSNYQQLKNSLGL